jgi:hypothetical protein
MFANKYCKELTLCNLIVKENSSDDMAWFNCQYELHNLSDRP